MDNTYSGLVKTKWHKEGDMFPVKYHTFSVTKACVCSSATELRWVSRLATWVSLVWTRLGSQFYALNFVGLELLLTNVFILLVSPPLAPWLERYCCLCSLPSLDNWHHWHQV